MVAMSSAGLAASTALPLIISPLFITRITLYDTLRCYAIPAVPVRQLKAVHPVKSAACSLQMHTDAQVTKQKHQQPVDLLACLWHEGNGADCTRSSCGVLFFFVLFLLLQHAFDTGRTCVCVCSRLYRACVHGVRRTLVTRHATNATGV